MIFEAHSRRLPLIMSYSLDSFPAINSTSPALYALPQQVQAEGGVLLYNPYSVNNSAIGKEIFSDWDKGSMNIIWNIFSI